MNQINTKTSQNQLQSLNQQLLRRAQKFGAQFTPLTPQQFNAYKLQKAQQTGKISYLENILLQDITDMQQRKNTIQRRAKNFFNVSVNQPQQFFNEKISAPKGTQIRQNSWYLFGVDYMSNESIRNYFNHYPHFKIQWLNDSSCNIIFQSAEEANDTVIQKVVGESFTDQNNIVWYQLEQYEVDGIKRRLYCRKSTMADTKGKQITGKDSRYYQWVKNKQKLGKFIKQQAKQQIKSNRMEKRKPISHAHQQIKKEKIKQTDSPSASESQSKPNNVKQDSSDSSSGIDDEGFDPLKAEEDK